MVSSLLSESAAREVEAAVTRVEQSTSAQLVVAVIPRSAEHFRGRALVSIAWSLAAALGLLYSGLDHAALWAPFVEAGVLVCAFSILGWAPLHHFLISPARAEQAARARAFQLFAERGLYGTKGKTALLIFVSELERRVILLGDATIDAHLGQAGWHTEVERLIAAIRRGRLREGLLETIAELEPRLTAVAPHQASTENELPDRVLRD